MGHEITREMRKRALPHNEMNVWVAIGDHARDKDGAGCYASQATIARETGYSDRNVRRLLKKLEDRGAIVETQKPGRRTTRHYRILLDAVPIRKLPVRPAKMSGLEEVHDGVKTGQVVTQDRTSCHLRPDILTVKTGQDVRQTLIEPSLNPKREHPPDARARETRDIDIDLDIDVGEGPDSDAVKKESGFRKGVDDIGDKVPEIFNDDLTRKRAERKRELAEQREYLESKVIIHNGMATVAPETGKYAK
jgi:biotin operon repressor